MGVLDFFRRVAGTIWGDVSPEQPPAPGKPLDARDFAVRALLDHLAGLEFRIDDSPGPPKRFLIPRDRWLDEWPDAPENLVFPSVAAQPGEMVATGRGFENSPDESTIDAFGPGTVVLPIHEHQERLVLEVWATTRFQRAAVLAGIEAAFDASEEMSGIRLALPDYYGQVARFTLDRIDRIDDEESAKRRRRARVTVRMEVDVVRLVRYAELSPQVDVEMSDTSLQTPQT